MLALAFVVGITKHNFADFKISDFEILRAHKITGDFY